MTLPKVKMTKRSFKLLRPVEQVTFQRSQLYYSVENNQTRNNSLFN